MHRFRMTDRFAVHFQTTGESADEDLVTGYLPAAIERLEAQGLLERFHFFRYGHTEDQPSEVRLRLRGDREAIVEAERDRWEQLVSQGDIEAWQLTDWPREETFDEQGEALANQLFEVASRTSFLLNQAIDDTEIDPVDSFGANDSDDLGVGMWILFHALCNHQGYSIDDEIAACLETITNRLFLIGLLDGPDQMQQRGDQITEELQESIDRMEPLVEEQTE